VGAGFAKGKSNSRVVRENVRPHPYEKRERVSLLPKRGNAMLLVHEENLLKKELLFDLGKRAWSAKREEKRKEGGLTIRE